MMYSPSAKSLDHVAIAVHSIEDSASVFELISGETCSPTLTHEEQGVRIAFVGLVELLEPLGPDTTVARFLERRGQGLHHIAYRTDDLSAELERLATEGVQLIDHEPRAGARGHLIAFIHPSSTGGVLTELVQHTD